jgi:2-desacetyl-2-hydroxyethyl bacteriochlorophyllide A dehydrogenase
MRGIWLDNAISPRPRLRTDLPMPTPSPGEALVRVRLAGVCATDLALCNGCYPFRGVLGHEMVGEIVAAAGAPERIGERVVGEINIGCGSCSQCRAGRPNHCEQRRVLGIRHHNGAFADYLRLPLANLHRVPDSVADQAAVFCEPLAAALRVVDLVPVGLKARVLVVGAGRLGQLIARVLRLGAVELAVVARHASQRRALAAAAIDWLDEADVSVGDWDLVVEATGAVGGFELARRAVRPGGAICLKSTYREPIALDAASLVVDEVRLVGSRCGPFTPALRLLAGGLVDPLPLIDDCLPLAEGVDALARAAEPGALKLLIAPGDAPI